MKKIFDAIHGFIHFDELETALIHSIPFQRLQFIHQLGAAFYVYPGGTHKRFEHSMGVMQLASRMYDQIVPKPHTEESIYWRKILRFAALCHDLGHLPFSHVAEKALLGEEGHEAISINIIKSDYLRPIWETFTAGKKDPDEAIEHIIKIAVGEKKLKIPFSPWERILSEIITGDFFGTDRMDYLLRDSKCTGLAYGSFDYLQLLEMIRLLSDPKNPETQILGIEENGIEACESLLLARHFMHKRIYQYPSALSFTFHMSRFMEVTYKNATCLSELTEFLHFTDHHVLVELDKASKDSSHKGHFDALCIKNRKERFKAIPIQKKISKKTFSEIQKNLNLTEGHLEAWLTQGSSKMIGLSFPVLCKNGSIVLGENLSQVSIPFMPHNWIFVHPDDEQAIRQSLNHL